jgi:Predicted transcriptional regulator
MENLIKPYQLPEREIEILYVMWEADRPLMASEIAEADQELKLATVHTTLKRMLKKNLIEVVDFAKSGNVFGRCYQPTISMQEFELNKISNDYKRKKCLDITATNLVAALLSGQDNRMVQEELDRLEKLIQEKRKEILKGDD